MIILGASMSPDEAVFEMAQQLNKRLRGLLILVSHSSETQLMVE